MKRFEGITAAPAQHTIIDKYAITLHTLTAPYPSPPAAPAHGKSPLAYQSCESEANPAAEEWMMQALWQEGELP